MCEFCCSAVVASSMGTFGREGIMIWCEHDVPFFSNVISYHGRCWSVILMGSFLSGWFPTRARVAVPTVWYCQNIKYSPPSEMKSSVSFLENLKPQVLRTITETSWMTFCHLTLWLLHSVLDVLSVASRPRPDNERIMDVQEGRSSRLGVGRRARPFCSYL